MATDIGAIATEEVRLPIDTIVNGDGTASIPYLRYLRAMSAPIVEMISGTILGDLGLRSEISLKKDQTAIEKCVRPQTTAKYPWFTLAHLRDYLRFRTHLNQSRDFADVLALFEMMQDENLVSIVKIDGKKLVEPGLFGWRMVATDMRIQSTGLLVEHYMTFSDMIGVNEAWLHKVYEAWRSEDPDSMTLGQSRELARDALFSRLAYRELLFDGILKGEPSDGSLAEARLAAGDAILRRLTSSLNL